jgi:hypothetical protein
MSRPELPKFPAKGLERRRTAVNAHREMLLRKLKDGDGIDEVTDVFPALQAVLHPQRKRKTDKLNS